MNNDDDDQVLLGDKGVGVLLFFGGPLNAILSLLPLVIDTCMSGVLWYVYE